MYAGDEFYDDDTTSGIFDDSDDTEPYFCSDCNSAFCEGGSYCDVAMERELATR